MSCFVGKNTIHITLQMFVNPMAVKLESFRSREILHHFPSTFSLAVIEHLSNHFSFIVQSKKFYLQNFMQIDSCAGSTFIAAN